jgi:hypothetical protein
MCESRGHAGQVRHSSTFAVNDVGLDACSTAILLTWEQDVPFPIVELMGDGRKVDSAVEDSYLARRIQGRGNVSLTSQRHSRSDARSLKWRLTP